MILNDMIKEYEYEKNIFKNMIKSRKEKII